MPLQFKRGAEGQGFLSLDKAKFPVSASEHVAISEQVQKVVQIEAKVQCSLLLKNLELLKVSPLSGEDADGEEFALADLDLEQNPLALFSECVSPDCVMNRVKYPHVRCVIEDKIVQNILRTFPEGGDEPLVYCMYHPGMLLSDFFILSALIMHGYTRFDLQFVGNWRFAELLDEKCSGESSNKSMASESVENADKLNWMRCWAARFEQLLKVFAVHDDCEATLTLFRDDQHYVSCVPLPAQRAHVFVAIDYFDQFPLHLHTTPLAASVCTRPGGVIALARTGGMGFMAAPKVYIDIRRFGGISDGDQDVHGTSQRLYAAIEPCDEAISEHYTQYTGPRPRTKEMPAPKLAGWTTQIDDPDDPLVHDEAYLAYLAKRKELTKDATAAGQAWKTHCSKYVEASPKLYSVSGKRNFGMALEFFKSNVSSAFAARPVRMSFVMGTIGLLGGGILTGAAYLVVCAANVAIGWVTM